MSKTITAEGEVALGRFRTLVDDADLLSPNTQEYIDTVINGVSNSFFYYQGVKRVKKWYMFPFDDIAGTHNPALWENVPPVFVYLIESSAPYAFPEPTNPTIEELYQALYPDDGLYYQLTYFNYTSEYRKFDVVQLSAANNDIRKPNYIDLLDGYTLDNRVRLSELIITPVSDEILRVGYYKINRLEPIPKLRSVDWMEYEYQLEKNIPTAINIKDCVLGTLVILRGSSMANTSAVNGTYQLSDYLNGSADNLFTTWNALWVAAQPPDPVLPPFPPNFTLSYITTADKVLSSTQLKAITANNDWWQNSPQPQGDIGYSANHPMFAVNESRSNEWHLSPQPEGIGTLIMDGTRTIEIHAALEAGKYASDDSGNLRVASLGHFVERIAAMLGYRPEPDGTIDQDKERSIFARTLIKSDAGLAVGKYMAGRFGSIGLLMRRLPNRRKDNKWEPGGIVAIHDIPQLVTEVLDQLNQALNIQDSTSIQIRDGADTYEYPNQLALLSEIATGAIQQRRQVREIWASSIVSQQSINEVIAGMGLPAVSKSITINNQKIPYWGIQPDKSLQREIATVAYNVGVATGQLL